MRLVVRRHATAERVSSTGRDADRVLTDLGLEQAAWLGSYIASDQASRPEVIYCSPAPRARQTAESVAKACGIACIEDWRLSLAASPSDALSLAAKLADRSTACVVGHNDAISALVAVLLSGPTGTAPPLRTGEAAILEIKPMRPVEPGCATQIGRVRMPD